MEENAEVRSPAGDGQRRCTYCYQELNEMTDPRQLPCNHIVCLTCLENDWKLDELQCRACSKDIKVEKVELLPKATIEIKENATLSEDTAESHYCDICESPSPAVEYCIDCGKRICQAHKLSHEHYFKETHKTIKISVFAERPPFYNLVLCDQHNNSSIQFSCMHCDDMRCPSCLETSGPCLSAGSHKYQLLEKARTNLEAEIDDVLKEISKKITELCNLEKNTWQTVDELTENCEKMVKQVDECVNKKIEEIKRQSEEMKEAIAEYQADRLKKVEAYIQSITEKLENLESTKNSVQSCIRANHVTTLIKQKHTIIDDLKIKSKMDTSTKFNCHVMTLLLDEINSYGLQLKFSSAEMEKTSIKSIVKGKMLKLATEKNCRSIVFNEIGELVFASHTNVLLSSNNEHYGWRQPKDISFPHVDHIDCVAQLGMRLFAALSNGSIYEIAPHEDSHKKSHLFNIAQVSRPTKLCVSGRYLVASSGSSCVFIYNLFTREFKTYDIRNLRDISSMCFDHDGALLILDAVRERVCKFRIADGAAPVPVWTCDGIAEGLAMCVDTAWKHKCIFVAGSTQKIHVIHYEGRKVEEVQCKDFPNHIHGENEFCAIAVHKDVLVSSANRSPNFHTFKIK